jgi:SAM-dependent methyltransferase
MEQPRPETRPRLAHAVLDEPSRILKARKIVTLLGHDTFARARRILEIGCGSGVIAATLAKMGSPGLEVFAVDVNDNRLTFDDYVFEQVEGTTLPFDAAMFDIVITNHVIEHVGGPGAQLHHLEEIARVLTPHGVAYLAVPNKWRLVEPHFRLPLLSWLPQRLSDAYVRVLGRGSHYDCRPLGRREAMRLFARAGFTDEDATVEAIRSTLEIEFPDSKLLALASRHLPDALFRLCMPVIPTMIFRLRARS